VTEDPSPGLRSSPEIDTTVSHSARVWDYWLGGKENYPVDRDPLVLAHARALLTSTP
jgi:hypothetical protein